MRRHSVFSDIKIQKEYIGWLGGQIIATSPRLEPSLETGHSLRSSRGREADATLVQQPPPGRRPFSSHTLAHLIHFGTLWCTLRYICILVHFGILNARWLTWYTCHLGTTTASKEETLLPSHFGTLWYNFVHLAFFDKNC